MSKLTCLFAFSVNSVSSAAIVLSVAAGAALAQPQPDRLYTEHCAACHGADRLGAMGPALLPENLARLRRAEAEQVILQGRPATQMPAYSDKLGAEEARTLAEYIYAPSRRCPNGARRKSARRASST